jgi:hypothetical protein
VNSQPARRKFCFVSVLAPLFFVAGFFLSNGFCAAVAYGQPQSLEDAVGKLARRIASGHHERRVSLLWTNHAGLPEGQSERLRAAFSSQLEAMETRIAQGEAVPALRVWLEQTPARIVVAASVPADGGTSVVMEEAERGGAESDELRTQAVRLEKQLVWRQDRKILSAVFPGAAENTASQKKRMLVLAEDSVQLFTGEAGNWKLAATKNIPGPAQAPRGSRGQLLFAEEHAERVGILLPGRRCEANFEDDSAIVCANFSGEFPNGRLLHANDCGAQTWWLRGDGTDWTEDDRLLLRNAGSGKDASPVAELSMPGPVQAIGGAEENSSASVVVRNLSNGKYEVYRVTAFCKN